MKKNTICSNFHQLIQAGLCLLLFLFTVIWFPGTVRAADQLELNKPHPVTLEKNSDSLLYEFTVPEAGNISIKVKRTTPADSSEITVRLSDSDNLALTGNWTDSDVELPVYSTDKNRTFYIKIDGSYRINNTTYILTVNFQPADNWETEINDSTESADPITADKTWYGMIYDDNDPCDFYKISLDSNKKVSITFGPKEVSGETHDWNVYLTDSNNQSVLIYRDSTTQSYDCYLKKGTYYLKVENDYHAVNIPYAITYRESALKLEKPAITSIKAVGQAGVLSNWTEFSRIGIKNQGDATGYTIKVASKKNMKGVLDTKDISFDDTNTKNQVTLDTRLTILKSYYVQARSFIQDPFGTKIYGKYGSVICKNLKKSTYNKLK